MADNYLEKKMEEHLDLKGHSSYRPKTTPRGNRPGELIVKFTPCDLFITDIDAPGMTDIAHELVGSGFKVCFTLDDLHRGSRLAATLGARFLPPSLHPADDAVYLRITDNCFELTRSGSGIRITAEDSQHNTSGNSIPSLLIKSIAMEASILANLNDFHKNVLQNIKIEGFSL